MRHRGQLFKKAVDDTKTNKAKLAKHLKVTRSTLYSYFDEIKLNLDVLIEAGKYMKYDFSLVIPELANPERMRQLEENLDYKIKYMETAEKLIKVMEENAQYVKQQQHKK